MSFLKKLSFETIPVAFLLFTFWFANGFVGKVMGVFVGWAFKPESTTINGLVFPYQGDTWSGWKGYITGMWDKSRIMSFVSPFFDPLFAVLIILQCLPFVLTIISLFKGELMRGKERPWLMASAVSSLFVTSFMFVPEVLAGASDNQYLWQFMGFSLIIILYLKKFERS